MALLCGPPSAGCRSGAIAVYAESGKFFLNLMHIKAWLRHSESNEIVGYLSGASRAETDNAERRHGGSGVRNRKNTVNSG